MVLNITEKTKRFGTHRAMINRAGNWLMPALPVNKMTKDEIILKKLDRLERLVGILVQDKVKVKWVKAGVIMKLTGWDREKMRRARNAGEVEFKKQGGFWYNPDSISPIYINKKSIA